MQLHTFFSWCNPSDSRLFSASKFGTAPLGGVLMNVARIQVRPFCYFYLLWQSALEHRRNRRSRRESESQSFREHWPVFVRETEEAIGNRAMRTPFANFDFNFSPGCQCESAEVLALVSISCPAATCPCPTCHLLVIIHGAHRDLLSAVLDPRGESSADSAMCSVQQFEEFLSPPSSSCMNKSNMVWVCKLPLIWEYVKKGPKHLYRWEA